MGDRVGRGCSSRVPLRGLLREEWDRRWSGDGFHCMETALVARNRTVVAHRHCWYTLLLPSLSNSAYDTSRSDSSTPTSSCLLARSLLLPGPSPTGEHAPFSSLRNTLSALRPPANGTEERRVSKRSSRGVEAVVIGNIDGEDGRLSTVDCHDCFSSHTLPLTTLPSASSDPPSLAAVATQSRPTGGCRCQPRPTASLLRPLERTARIR